LALASLALLSLQAAAQAAASDCSPRAVAQAPAPAQGV